MTRSVGPTSGGEIASVNLWPCIQCGGSGETAIRSPARPMTPTLQGMPTRLLTLVLLANVCCAFSGCAVGSSSAEPPAHRSESGPPQPVAETRADGLVSPGQTPGVATTGAGADIGSPLWHIFEETRSQAGNDSGEQSGLIEERLKDLQPEQIVDFHHWYKSLDRSLYTWEVWGAAYVIDDGCSHDCFRDFRAYVISLGEKAYKTALRDPDNLAPIVQDAETGDWENADDVAAEAYSSVTGNDAPFEDSELEGNPRGRPWDDADVQSLLARYPNLAARFR